MRAEIVMVSLRRNYFKRHERSEKAFVLGIIEMYLWVSRQEISKRSWSPYAGLVFLRAKLSELASRLDHDLNLWRTRALTDEYVYLMFDARYEKVRKNGRVISKGFVVAVGIMKGG